MTSYEYEYLQERLRRKLDGRRPYGLSGKRAEGYEAGIKAAMSIIKEIHGFKEDNINQEDTWKD